MMSVPMTKSSLGFVLSSDLDTCMYVGPANQAILTNAVHSEINFVTDTSSLCKLAEEKGKKSESAMKT